ncbi:hypothetical protein MMC27_003662 [Xylographa pallens]|nr:hypothetical protein [Xylographa pallens]
MPREALAGGVSVNGHHFPEGVDVAVPHYALHHNEASYPDLFESKRSRWLVGIEAGVTGKSVQLARWAFCASSVGPRGFLGKGMVYMEMSIALALKRVALRQPPCRRVDSWRKDDDGRVSIS